MYSVGYFDVPVVVAGFKIPIYAASFFVVCGAASYVFTCFLIPEVEDSGILVWMGADPINLPSLGDLLPSLNWGDVGIADWEGHSAQGRFGAVNFSMEETILIEDERLMSMHLGEIADSSLIDNNAPDFVRARRAAVFQPEGVVSNEELESNAHDAAIFWSLLPRKSHTKTVILPDLGENPGNECGSKAYSYVRPCGLQSANEDMWQEHFNAFRVRMVNVPMIASNDFSLGEYKQGAAYDNAGDESRYSIRGQYRYLVHNANYLLCDGMEGFVMSNAGKDIDASGKEYADDPPIFRDVVYPRVEITSDEDEYDLDECLSDVGIDEYEVEELGELGQDTLDNWVQWLDSDTEIIIPVQN